MPPPVVTRPALTQRFGTPILLPIMTFLLNLLSIVGPLVLEFGALVGMFTALCAVLPAGAGHFDFQLLLTLYIPIRLALKVEQTIRRRREAEAAATRESLFGSDTDKLEDLEQQLDDHVADETIHRTRHISGNGAKDE